MKIYEKEREIVERTFSRLGGRISLSVDTLFFEKPSESLDYYMSIAAHFIDNKWKLRKWVLKYCNYGDYDCPSKAVMDTLIDWAIKSNIFSVTVVNADGGGFVDLVKEEIEGENNIPLNGQFFNLKCSSQVVSQMMQVAFNMIEGAISKIEMVSGSRSSPLWYKTISMLKDAQKDGSTQRYGRGCPQPKKGEWAKIRTVSEIGGHIYKIVEPLFAVERPTANLFLPHLLQTRAYLRQELTSTSSHAFVKALAQEMLVIFDQYWKEMFLVLAIAAFLDPRYKMNFIEFSFSKLEDGDSKTALVLETIRKLYECYEVRNNQECCLSDSSSESEDEEDEEEFVEHKKKQSYEIADRLDLLRMYCKFVESTNDERHNPVLDNDLPQKTDLDLYLEERVVPWTEDFSVLLWWKDNSVKYPILAKMARDILAIPMTVATLGEAYYTEPRPADKTVMSSEPELMNALMCTRSWKLSRQKYVEKHQDDPAVNTTVNT